MPCKYDPDTLTLFDLETGASVATIHVPDNGSFEEAHRIGYLMAAAVLEAHDRRIITETVHEVLGQMHERGCSPVLFKDARR